MPGLEWSAEDPSKCTGKPNRTAWDRCVGFEINAAGAAIPRRLGSVVSTLHLMVEGHTDESRLLGCIPGYFFAPRLFFWLPGYFLGGLPGSQELPSSSRQRCSQLPAPRGWVGSYDEQLLDTCGHAVVRSRRLSSALGPPPPPFGRYSAAAANSPFHGMRQAGGLLQCSKVSESGR